MAIYPEILAGYEAATAALSEHAVSIKDPRVPTTFPTDPVGMLRAGPQAYSVEGTVLREGINLCRNGRFGFDEEWLFVDYPLPHTDPAFAARLAEVLVPAVEGLLARALEQRTTEQAALPKGAPVEAWEAVTEVTE